MAQVKQRLIPFQIIGNVLAVCVVVIQGWAFFNIFREIPALRARDSAWDIIGVVAYVQAFALLESLVVAFLLLLVAFIFPAQLLRDKLVSQSGAFMGISTVGAIIVHYLGRPVTDWSLLQTLIGLAVYLTAVAIVYVVVDRLAQVEQAINTIVSKVVVLAQVYAVIGLLSWLLVIVRNV